MTIYHIFGGVAVAATLLTILNRAIGKVESLDLAWVKNFIGAFFIFSGGVKAIDPIGTAYKMEQYFQVFQDYGIPLMKTMESLSVYFSFFMIIFEVVLGVTLLLGVFRKFTVWNLLLMIIFFTFLTGFTHFTGKVTDCGCFGDFLKLKPLQSFYKDLILTAMIGYLFIKRDQLKELVAQRLHIPILTGSTLVLLLFCMQNYVWNLPMADFRPFHEGVNILEAKAICEADIPVVEKSYTYKNKQTGETKKVTSAELGNFPFLWEDKNWEIQKDLTTEKILNEGCTSKIKEFALDNAEGSEVTDYITENPDYNFVVVAYDLDHTSKRGFKTKVNPLAAAAEKDGLKTFAAYASGNVEDFRHENQTAYPFLSGDGIMLKTIIRSSPGIMLLKNGTIIKKWHWKKMPNYETIKKKYMK